MVFSYGLDSLTDSKFREERRSDVPDSPFTDLSNFPDSGVRGRGTEPTITMTKASSTVVILLVCSGATYSAESPAISVYGREQLRVATENRRVAHLIGYCLDYAEKNGGRFPGSLEEIRNVNNLQILLNEETLGDFGNRHAFIKGDFNIPGLGKVYTISSSPSERYIGAPKGDGRIVGYMGKDGVPSAYWLPEDEIQRLLALNPSVEILPPMGPVPAPNMPLPKHESPPNEHHLRVLEHYGVKLKTATPPAEDTSPPPVISSPPPATSNPQASPPDSTPWRYVVTGLIAVLGGAWIFAKKRKKRPL